MFHQAILPLLSIYLIFEYASSTAASKRIHGRKKWPAPPYICYDCINSDCDNPHEQTCDGALNCFTHIEIIEGKYIYREKGCLNHILVEQWFCHDAIKRRERNETNPLKSCCAGDFCNGDVFPIPSIPDVSTQSPALPTSEIKEEQIEELSLTIAIKAAGVTFSLYIILFLTFITLGCACINSYRRMESYMVKPSDIKRPNLLPRFCLKRTDSNSLDGVSVLSHDMITSGSGSGFPTLNQRSLFQDVNLIKCIGKGRYGEVWQGTKLGERVAVKIFSTIDEASWKNEVYIYTTIALYHENVLGFKGSSVGSRFGVTEMWLLTTFHELGSLYDYLLENAVTHEQLLRFVRSACAGILHLHTEIVGSKGKPAIAHRDLKTRNILVTSHGTCVIADFGLAVVKTGETSSTDKLTNYRVGTKRYMAPEVLDETMNINTFESFKRADMYAFGLILWEVCSRCITDGTVEDFCLAFYDCVPNNPDFEDMKKVVCIEFKRPEIPERWSSDELLNTMASLMKMCWHKNPSARYSALRVIKTIDKIHTQTQEGSATA